MGQYWHNAFVGLLLLFCIGSTIYFAPPASIVTGLCGITLIFGGFRR